MNELTAYFPNNAMANLADDLANVKTWADFERRFLLGNGKSQHTNRSYLTACRAFYDFTGGLHPMQAGTPEYIEQWYDSLTGSVNTKYLRIAGLKYMYKRICERYPFYTSPFGIMPESLNAKLSRSGKDESERDAFTEKEYQAVLRMLRADRTLKGRQDYALFRWGVTSGMRAAELCGLRWENVSELEGCYRATFTGKGRKTRTIQIEGEAYKAAVSAFRARHGRKPTGSEYVFQTLPNGRSGAGLSTASLGVRISGIAERAKAAGIVRANLHVSPHVMRHTCATRLVAAGVPIDAVQRHLGHGSISTTALYLHNAIDLSATWAKMSGEAAA